MTKPGVPVSVVIPAHNNAAQLPAAIESVCRQTRAPREIIVIDDGSSDNTPDLLRAYGDRVRSRRQQNAGSAVARNVGIELSTSDWIAFLDADDLWSPDHLERCWQVLSNNPALVWCCATHVLIAHDQRQSRNDLHRWRRLPSTRVGTVDFFDAWVARAPIQTSGFILKKSVLVSAGLFSPEMRRGQDRDLWFRIALQHRRLGIIWPPSVQYIRTEASVTARRADLTQQMLHRLEKRVQRLPQLDDSTARAFEKLLRYLAREIVWHALSMSRPDCLSRLLDEFGWLLTRWERLIAWCGSRTPAVLLRQLSSMRRLVT